MKRLCFFLGGIICVIVVLLYIVLAEGPLAIFTSTERNFSCTIDADEVKNEILTRIPNHFSPYYFQSFMDDNQRPVHVICSYLYLGFDSQYVVHELTMQDYLVKNTYYVGEARAFREHYPQSVITEDQHFFEHITPLLQGADERSQEHKVIYCDNRINSIPY